MIREAAIEYIKNHCPIDHRLAQLAEECAELAQAALKLRRAMGMGTPTPCAPAAAKLGVMDEMADVLSVMLVLVTPENIEKGYICDQMTFKIKRWADRLREAEN